MRELRARRLASQANKDLTHKMQTVLSGLESPYRKIEWKIDATQAIQSQTLPKAVAEIVQTFLNDAGLKSACVAAAISAGAICLICSGVGTVPGSTISRSSPV